jgi:tetratricopeptide (TPR) repeat protein
MSLLLEALKKAEKAKEEALRRTQPERLSLEEAKPDEEKRVLTRDQLPSISTPLEILSDDLSGRAANTPEAPRQAAARPSDPQAGERAAARNVFEAKFREPNPRLPFYATLGALGLFAIGTVVYFWYQLRPPYPLVNAHPAPAVQVAAPTPVKVAAPPTQPATGQIPGLPNTTTTEPKTAAASKTPAIPRAASAPRPLVAPPAERPVLPARVVEVSRPAAQVHPRVESGYAAYLAGDLAKARAEYDQALRDDPANRDALLGAAAVAVRSGRFEAAEAAYLRLLQSDPRDAHAQAGLMALRSARIDPVSGESRVKTMLAADPAAHVLNFTLGNQLAQQGRWAEAQQQYFKAFAGDPDNPDFAYNLAVSLDHLRQHRLALEYYQRALSLAEKRGASFSVEDARNRARKLGN